MADLYGDGYTGGYVLPEVVEGAPVVVGNTPDHITRVDWIHDVNPAGFERFDPTWSDLSAYVRVGGFGFHRGRARPLDRNEAGTDTVVLDNREGHFEPANEVGPFFPNVSPMRRLQEVAVFPRDSQPFTVGSSLAGGDDLVGGGAGDDLVVLFDGYIESLEYDYPEKGKTATVTIKAVDMLGAFARESLLATPGYASPVYDMDPNSPTFGYITSISSGPATSVNFAGFLGYQAIHVVLNEKSYTGALQVGGVGAGDGSRAISENNGMVMWTTSPLGEVGMLDTIYQLADSEGGNFFIARDGTITYRDRRWSERPTDSEFRFSSDPADESYSEIAFTLDETVIYNDITLTGHAGILNASDAQSIAHYFQRPLGRTTYLYSTADWTARLEAMLLRYRKPQKVITRLDMSNVVADWRAVLERELWDKISVSVTLPNGDVVEQVSQIEGIEISSPSKREWRVVWWLSVAPFPNLLSDDDSNFENGIGGWMAETNCTISSATTGELGVYVVDGTKALRMDAIADGDATAVSPSLAVDARRRYRAEVLVSGLWGPPKYARVETDWIDSGSAVLSTILGEDVYLQGARALSVEGSAPDAAITAIIRVRVVDADSGLLYSYFPQGHIVDAASFVRSE